MQVAKSNVTKKRPLRYVWPISHSTQRLGSSRKKHFSGVNAMVTAEGRFAQRAVIRSPKMLRCVRTAGTTGRTAALTPLAKVRSGPLALNGP